MVLSRTAPNPHSGRARINAVRGVAGKTAKPDGFWQTLDCVILFCTTTLTPQLDHIKLQVPGLSDEFSLAWIYFAGLLAYVLARGFFVKLLSQPVVIAAIGFVGFCGLYECLMPPSRLDELIRFSQSLAGGILIAALCINRRAMNYALLGILASGLWLSFDVYTASYNTLARAGDVGFEEASNLRAQTMDSLAIAANLNRVGFLCAEGAIVAFTFAFFHRTLAKRLVFVAFGMPCLLGTLLVQSRSAAVTVLAAFALLVASVHGKRVWIFTSAIIIAGIVWAITPAAAFGRFAAPTTRSTGEINDSRIRVYQAAFQAFPKYALTGVGAGRFFSGWAVVNGMQTDGRVLGAHNAYLQVLINWGLPGLAIFLAFLWQCYRCLPNNCWSDQYAFALLGLTAALFIRLFFAHDFYVKDLGLLVGLLLAGKVWIWPGQNHLAFASHARSQTTGARFSPRRRAALLRRRNSIAPKNTGLSTRIMPERRAETL